MIEKNVDILVIGAGPAGVSVAAAASQYGVNILIVEKETKLAAKPCAEATSKSTLEEFDIKIDSKLVRNKIKRVLVYPPNEQNPVEIKGEEYGGGFIIDKRVLLERILEKAVDKGAEFWLNSPALDFKVNDKGFISEVIVAHEGEKVKVKPKIVVACDGVGSIIAQKLFDRSGYTVIPTLQYIIANTKIPSEDTIMIWVGRKWAPLGYLWLFPRGGGEVGLGLGVRGASLREYLNKFIKHHEGWFKKSFIVEIGSAPVPIGGQIKHVVKGNVMVCGDAAGQVIPLTGAGIHSSIVAGKIAGRVAAEAILEENMTEEKLVEYEREYNKYWGSRIRKSLKVLKIIEGLSDEDLNKLATLIGGQDIIDLANGLNVARVGLKLLKNPYFAFKMARKLLEIT